MTEDGAILAGQWIADAADRERIVRDTRARAAHPGHVVVGQARDSAGGDAGSVVVQARGADRRLRALPGQLADGRGALLRELGRLTPPAGLPVRDAAAELGWLGTWLDRVAQHLPHVHGRLAPVLDVVAQHLAGTPVWAPGVVHGDLHDGQVLVAEDGGVGVLDWDTLAVGEAALDAGNVWAHADLRRVLGQWPDGGAADMWDAVVETWAPSRAELDRAAAYRRLILLRLACQYAFRPAHAHAVDPLVQLAAAPCRLSSWGIPEEMDTRHERPDRHHRDVPQDGL